MRTRKPRGRQISEWLAAFRMRKPRRPAQNFFNRLAQMSDTEWERHKSLRLQEVAAHQPGRSTALHRYAPPSF